VDEPVSKPVTQPIIEPIIEPINEARGEPLPSPGYDKLDHAAEYGILGALLWLALYLTAKREEAPQWLRNFGRGWNLARPSDREAAVRWAGGISGRTPGSRVITSVLRVFTPLVLLATVITSLYGATDELHQSFVPERMADIRDWVADTLGGLLGALFMAAVIPRMGRELAERGWRYTGSERGEL